MRYTKLLIGFIFIFITFKVNNFDVLPNFIGYIFLFIALGDLKNISKYFAKAQILIILPLFLSVASLFSPIFNFPAYVPMWAVEIKYIALILYIFLFSIYNLIVYYLIFSGIIYHLKFKNNLNLAYKVKSRFTLFFIIYLLFYCTFYIKCFISFIFLALLIIVQLLLIYTILEVSQYIEK